MSISFELLDESNKEWNNVANQISQVSWRAGKSLSEKCTLIILQIGKE